MKFLAFGIGLLLLFLSGLRIHRKDFSFVTAVLFAVLGYFIGKSTGIMAFGTAINGVWVFCPLFFYIGGTVHVKNRC